MGKLFLNKFQVPSSKFQKNSLISRHLKIGIWILVFIWNLVLGTWSFARELPPILQVLEREPSNLEDIEELVDFRWYDVAWEALKQYPKEEKVLFLKAKTLAGLKKYDEALQLFDSLIRDVQNPEIRRDCILRKAYILTRLKRYNENLIKNIPVAKMQRKLSARAFKVALEARNYQKALQLLKGMGPAETSWWRDLLFRREKMFIDILIQ